MTPFMILLAFVLGILVGSITKININISHTHKHIMDKPVDKSDKPVEYNASYGDPEKMQYLNQQFLERNER